MSLLTAHKSLDDECNRSGGLAEQMRGGMAGRPGAGQRVPEREGLPVASRTAIQRFSRPRPETRPRTAPWAMKAWSDGEVEKRGLLSQAGGYQGAQQTRSPRYMRTMTRRKRSACWSQYGMRCGGGPGGTAWMGSGGGGGGTAGAVGIAWFTGALSPACLFSASRPGAESGDAVGLGKLSVIPRVDAACAMPVSERYHTGCGWVLGG